MPIVFQKGWGLWQRDIGSDMFQYNLFFPPPFEYLELLWPCEASVSYTLFVASFFLHMVHVLLASSWMFFYEYVVVWLAANCGLIILWAQIVMSSISFVWFISVHVLESMTLFVMLLVHFFWSFDGFPKCMKYGKSYGHNYLVYTLINYNYTWTVTINSFNSS